MPPTESASANALPREALQIAGDAAAAWRGVAARVREWAAEQGIALRDAVVLLPFAALLPAARAAFAAAPGWMPRIETPLTLAASLGPPGLAAPGQLGFDPVADRLAVAQLLRSQPWGSAWARRDPRAFDAAVAAVASTAQALARAAAHHAPDARTALLAHWRELLAPLGGPGARQRALALLALEWAAQAAAPSTDRLFALRVAGWIVVQAGGADPLAQALVEAHAGVPRLWLDLDPPEARRFDAVDAPAFALCDDFEHEAQCSAAQVLAHLREGEAPVALIAQDRMLARRVRALLERQDVALLDETGWKLSTTRAAARLMTLLKAARPGGPTDAVLDWLKSGTRWSRGAEGALALFEADCRRHQRVRVDSIAPERLPEPARGLWTEAQAVLAALHAPGRQPLAAWLAHGLRALDEAGALDALRDDDAGRQMLAELHLDGDEDDAARWARRVAPDSALRYDEFVAWVDDVLEQASFLPGAGASASEVQVVITPLARAMLRPFAAVVCPGADARRLGAPPAPHPLLADALLGPLGLTDAAAQREAEARAFAQLLRLPRLTLLRRRRDGDEPLTDSPLVERLRLALARRGAVLHAWRDPRGERRIDAAPVAPGMPTAAALLPEVLSASACEALRDCPYRFFTLYVLRAREDDELDDEVEKRDYGNWLHAVLHDFHAAREVGASEEEDLALLRRCALSQRTLQGLDGPEFVPFAASFEDFAPRYVAWQRARDAAGARWREGEREWRVPLPQAAPFVLEGVVDRIDALSDGALELIDYKTGSRQSLVDKVRDPQEDTQLAFYAALVGADTPAELHAQYLVLDGREIVSVKHPEVRASAGRLVEGLAGELQRLRAGAAMPPLGEGRSCDFCAARGVCRRDHWSGPVAVAQDASGTAGTPGDAAA